MKNLAPHEKYCSEFVSQTWAKIWTSKLAGGKKIGKCPEVVFKELDDDLNGQAFPDHIESNSSRPADAGPDAFQPRISDISTMRCCRREISAACPSAVANNPSSAVEMDSFSPRKTLQKVSTRRGSAPPCPPSSSPMW